MKFREHPGYSFDDVLLVPQHSKVQSRLDIDLSTKVGKLELSFPTLSANMHTVTDVDMAMAMGDYGGAGVLHRKESDQRIELWAETLRRHGSPCIISVGVDRNDDSVELIRRIRELSRLDAVCVDVAHGDSVKALRTIDTLRGQFRDLDIIAGNVATHHGAARLVNAGANIIKVGIGPGSVCSTRVVTGHGVPQLTAIIEVCEGLKNEKTNDHREAHVIADGGIRYPGDVVKALAAGADAVMLGSLLAGTMESPGYVFVEHRNTYKTFCGSASFAAQGSKKSARVEGVSAQVAFRGPVEWTLNNIRDGLRSGCSYSGAHNLAELKSNAEFQVVTMNSVRESHPHQPYVL